jgi:protein ImuB
MLFACVFASNFVVQAALRCEPTEKRIVLSQRPVAIVDGPDSLPRVFACNQKAQLAGIEVGMTKAQAEQSLGAIVRKRVIAHEHAAQAALIDCASSFSPRVESTTEGVVTLDITGTERVFGPPLKLATALAQATSRIGLDTNVTVASNPDAALVAARGFTGTVVIGAGEETTFLAQLPIEVLGLRSVQAEILDSWGIRRCRDLAALPPVPLTERLGQAGLHLQKLARGEINRPIIPADPPLQFKESFELEESVTDLESLAFILNRLLDQISVRLLSRALATDEICLRLGVEIHQDRNIQQESKQRPDAVFERSLKLPVPMQDAKVLLKLLQLDLAAHNPSAPVKTVTIEAKPARIRHTQSGLFAPVAPEPERLEVTVARLRGIIGETDEHGRSRIGSPSVLNTHRPDTFRVGAFNTQQPNVAAPENDGHAVALRIFRPPFAARVRCQDAKPIHVSFAEVSSEVACAAGPWKASGQWWNSKEQWEQEQWDVALRLPLGIGIYRIFRDLKLGTWFVEGLYD